MGRPPCCDKVGVKKGPWTPEEDIALVSFVQENGPGNWRAVPIKTGLKRCSKSCRLRWANYLRPGIKRGSFTDHEEKMIIQLQALLGNKWAAIASYLPERTDNDIKNYWNTHVKKKHKRLQIGSGNHSNFDGFSPNSNSNSISRGQWERRLQTDINTAKQALQDALSFENTNHLPELVLSNPNEGCLSYPKPGLQQPFAYASSTENIARLLKDWMKKTPKSEESKSPSSTQNSSNNEIHSYSMETKSGIDLSEAFEFLFGYDQSSNSAFSRSTSTITGLDPNGFAVLEENWLLDEQGKEYLTNFSFDENQDLF